MSKIQKQECKKFEIQYYLLELQLDSTHEAFKVRRGMTDLRKYYSNQIQLSLLSSVQIKRRNNASFGCM